MTPVSQADRDAENGAVATFASQGDSADPTIVADAAGQVDEIQDFFLSAGDKIDLSDVAAFFKMSADDVQDALYYNELSRGTEIGIEVDGVPHKIAVVHGVTAAALCSSSPWIFDPAEAAAMTDTRDREETAQNADRAPDEFVFGEALIAAAPRPIVTAAKPADVTQLAEALGLSEAQVLDALKNNRLTPNGDGLIEGSSQSTALADADALIL